MQHISIISFGFLEIELLNRLASDVQPEFNLPVNITKDHLDISLFYDPSRRQYDGNKLLKLIDIKYSSEEGKTLGLFGVDLFIPILTYIFGQAYLGGRTAIASMYRLNNERYGMVINDTILYDRLLKEVIHELGHTFGLIHCHDQTCVMRSSTYVEDIDQKSHHFCTNCKSSVQA